MMELIRARTQTMLAWQQQILGIVSGLPSGYNMDYQETKRPFMEALDMVQECLDISSLVMSKLTVNTERTVAACTFELFAADRAYDMAMTSGIPFRDAYKIVGAEVTAQLDRGIPSPVETQEQLVARLHARSHLGGPGNLGLAQDQERLEEAQKTWTGRAIKFKEAIQQLAGPYDVKIFEEL
jgi:argininosuccinate lyase